MRVLVTGGAGYIGSHTVLALLRQGHDVVVVDNLKNSHEEALTRVMDLAGRGFPYHVFDVRDEAKLDEVFSKRPIDAVIHFAGLKAVGESVSMPLEYYENNLDSTLVLCKVMKRHNVKRIIFSSSATVYAPGSPMPVGEEAILGCTNPYGWTKFMCERILSDIAHADPSWSVALLRYFNPIGADASGRIGEDPQGIPNNLMPYISQTALGRLPMLSVYGNDYETPDGTGVRDYIHVVDLADGHVAALDYVSEHTGCEAINLGTGQGYSVLEMLHAFERVNDVEVPYQIVARRPGDVAAVYADAAKAGALLNWQAKKTLEDMCRDSWRWQTQNPQGFKSI